MLGTAEAQNFREKYYELRDAVIQLLLVDDIMEKGEENEQTIHDWIASRARIYSLINYEIEHETSVSDLLLNTEIARATEEK